MTRKEMKTLAKQQIKGNIGILFVIGLVISLINTLVNLIPVVGSVAMLLIAPAFSVSVISIYLNLARGVKPQVADAFNGLKDFWTAFKVTFLVGLYTMLWSLLFVIPGIIKGFSYSQALYIAAENPGISAREAIRRSQEMMNGHKMDLFVLTLSFIGWAILAPFTLYILLIWLMPYMNATFTNFYNSIKPAPVYAENPYAAPYAPTTETY